VGFVSMTLSVVFLFLGRTRREQPFPTSKKRFEGASEQTRT
jgi:hypothetical protein